MGEDEMTHRRGYRISAVDLGLVIAGLVIGVFVAEIGLRLVDQRYGYYQTEPLNTATQIQEDIFIQLRLHRPNTHYQFSPSPDYIEKMTDSLQPGVYVSDTDPDGLYKPGAEHKNPDLTILFLGGSTTENFFMKPEQRFPYAVAHLIEKHHKLKVNGLNMAMSGNVSMHSINNFLNLGLKLKPNVAILMENINDYAMLYHERSYWNDHPNRSLLSKGVLLSNTLTGNPWDGVRIPTSTAARSVVRNLWFRLTPHLAQRLSTRFGWKESTPYSGDPQDLRWKEPQPFDLDRIEFDFRRSLRTFVAVARAWGVQPVLMTQPNRWPDSVDVDVPRSVKYFMQHKAITTVDYKKFLSGYKRLQRAIMDVAADEIIPVINLEVAIPRDTDHLFDPVHLTGKGSLVAAEYISRQLENLGLIPR
jgi:hypothetical protein